MNNRTAERCCRSRVAVIHPSPFAVKSMYMHYLKTKSPYGSDMALSPNPCRKWGWVYYSHVAIHPARRRAGILASE